MFMVTCLPFATESLSMGLGKGDCLFYLWDTLFHAFEENSIIELSLYSLGLKPKYKTALIIRRGGED